MRLLAECCHLLGDHEAAAENAEAAVAICKEDLLAIKVRDSAYQRMGSSDTNSSSLNDQWMEI